jgi:hypothetical protein
MSDDWDLENEMAPEGPPEELLHLALTCNGGWGLSVKDALMMREHMEAGKLPLGDSSWKHELEQQLLSQMHLDARRIAWAAYRQGILHGELLSKARR